MIDDYSLMEGGFLVWFGNAPPQHAYLESWICGAVSIAVYVAKTIRWTGISAILDVNLIANAYRDFYLAPDTYYVAYRAFLTAIDLFTAVLVYFLARDVLRGDRNNYWPVMVAVLYLFSYNTYWVNLVGRPDTLTAFFTVLGVSLYLRSGPRTDSPFFWGAAAALGCAAGLKLHGSFTVIFLALERIRSKGLKDGMKAAMVLGSVSVLFFLLADGSLLFDPLKYVKARWLTSQHDRYTWIHWGNQVVEVLRGSGWISAFLVFASPIFWYFRKEPMEEKSRIVAFLAAGWIVLFLCIRQLRAYWMLPALPMIYITSVSLASRIRPAFIARGLAVIMILFSFTQSIAMAADLRRNDLDELRRWIRGNVSVQDPFFIIGYEVVQLPRNSRCLANISEMIHRSIEKDRASGIDFTRRHLKNWEEESVLRLIDMLGGASDGYEYYSSFLHPEIEERGLDKMNYVIIQDTLYRNLQEHVKELVRQRFAFLGRFTGPGGDGTGLQYSVYQRRS